jgi:hypothetical protein
MRVIRHDRQHSRRPCCRGAAGTLAAVPDTWAETEIKPIQRELRRMPSMTRHRRSPNVFEGDFRSATPTAPAVERMHAFPTAPGRRSLPTRTGAPVETPQKGLSWCTGSGVRSLLRWTKRDSARQPSRDSAARAGGTHVKQQSLASALALRGCPELRCPRGLLRVAGFRLIVRQSCAPAVSRAVLTFPAATAT